MNSASGTQEWRPLNPLFQQFVRAWGRCQETKSTRVNSKAARAVEDVISESTTKLRPSLRAQGDLLAGGVELASVPRAAPQMRYQILTSFLTPWGLMTILPRRQKGHIDVVASGLRIGVNVGTV